jgi:ubiquinone/menaquinone biosynthesis C-methylase UbiE
VNNGDPYRLIAPLYDPLVELAAKDIRRACMRIYTPTESIAVLDVGCGTGTQLKQYQRARCRVSGIDASPAMLDRARMKLGESADLCLGTATRLPYADGSFGLVTCVITLHEMPPSERRLAVEECKRVTSLDGRILLADYNPGPYSFPDGWMWKLVALFFEIAAGRQHFLHYRDFLARQGLLPLIDTERLRIERAKLIGGGNIAVYLLTL